MIIPDANLLLYAYDAKSPFHARAKAWWEQLLDGEEEVGMCPVVLFAFVRIATSSRAFDRPMKIAVAADHARSWLDVGLVTVLETGAADCLETLRMLEAAGAGGDLTTDAQIAAAAARYKATVHTADTDFARFGVRWKNPLVA